MNIKKIKEKLSKLYPGKSVIITNPNNPGEIICETIPGKEKSEAIAVIDYTRLHYHRILTEIYEVIKGELKMTIDGEKKILKKGDSITILPGTKHSAIGNETWIKVYSTPGWSSDDHFLVVGSQEISRKEYDE